MLETASAHASRTPPARAPSTANRAKLTGATGPRRRVASARCTTPGGTDQGAPTVSAPAVGKPPRPTAHADTNTRPRTQSCSPPTDGAAVASAGRASYHSTPTTVGFDPAEIAQGRRDDELCAAVEHPSRALTSVVMRDAAHKAAAHLEPAAPADVAVHLASHFAGPLPSRAHRGGMSLRHCSSFDPSWDRRRTRLWRPLGASTRRPPGDSPPGTHGRSQAWPARRRRRGTAVAMGRRGRRRAGNDRHLRSVEDRRASGHRVSRPLRRRQQRAPHPCRRGRREGSRARPAWTQARTLSTVTSPDTCP